MIINNSGKQAMDSGRLASLTDGIFGFSMTILATNLAIPEYLKIATNSQLNQILLMQQHKFFEYMLSFILLAVFWAISLKHFQVTKRTNGPHVWINIILLMFIVMIPFASSVTGNFPDDKLASIFFSLNLFIVGILFLVNWLYLCANTHLLDEKQDMHKNLGVKRLMVIPLASLVAIVLSLMDISSTHYIFLVIPLVLAIPYFKR